MKRAEVLDATESIFRRTGFQVSERCVARASCFDFVARREEQLALIKVPINIGNVSRKDALELQAISRYLSTVPLLICDKTRNKPLEDDTVYMRYNIYTITLKTLEDIVFRGMHPLVEAGPGGYYVNLDGSVIREKRQKLGLSVGKLAEMTSISRRTLYGYEKGMAKASVSTAYNLEWILGIPVVQPIDIFRRGSQSIGLFALAKRMIIKNRFLSMVLSKLTRLNCRVAPVGRAPFDFIAQFPKEQLNIIGGVADKRDQNIDQRTREIISISRVIDAPSVFVTDGEQIPNNNIPLIHHDELSKLRHPEEFIALL
ncbi:MAG: hypothetical protein AOA65_0492 [Candidatus Bathyarchaeota archaeon BA1]|nr:MAG: hypothetical protein AOA65_0492 [Candidatus Bathyarchaeota archaeon BA1]